MDVIQQPGDSVSQQPKSQSVEDCGETVSQDEDAQSQLQKDAGGVHHPLSLWSHFWFHHVPEDPADGTEEGKALAE